jgi:hypothetical protein
LTDFLKALTPDCTTALAHPSHPVSGLWVVRHESVQAEQISSGADETTREFTVVLYHQSEETVLAHMDALHQRVKAGDIARGDGVAVRLSGLGFSSPMKLESGLFALLGTLKTTCRTLTSDAQGYGTEPLTAGVHTSITE